MHNGGTIPIVSDGSAKLGFQGHASDFSLLNKIMIIMETRRTSLLSDNASRVTLLSITFARDSLFYSFEIKYIKIHQISVENDAS